MVISFGFLYNVITFGILYNVITFGIFYNVITFGILYNVITFGIFYNVINHIWQFISSEQCACRPKADRRVDVLRTAGEAVGVV
jgi:hypothetical protein